MNLFHELTPNLQHLFEIDFSDRKFTVFIFSACDSHGGTCRWNDDLFYFAGTYFLKFLSCDLYDSLKQEKN